jgi:hypothetical protein
MEVELEDAASIDPLALEHGRAIVQCVCQDVRLCGPPGDELPVEPDVPAAVRK